MRMSFRCTDSVGKRLRKKEEGSLPALRKRRTTPAGACGGTSVSASLTLEAACTLPLFLCAVLAVLYFTDAAVLQVRLLNGIREAGRQMAVAAAAGDLAGRAEGESLGLSGTVLSAAYAKSAVKKAAGTLPERVMGGDITLLGSTFLEDEMIDLRVSGRLKIPVPFFSVPGIRYWQRGYVRAWTGRASGAAGGEDGAGEEDTAVYVTATGSVYHLDENCTHIRLSIRQVGLDQAKALRSLDGSKYYACACYEGEGAVYITSDGNRYHGTLECSRLKRSVRKVNMDEVQDMRACSKCGKEGG